MGRRAVPFTLVHRPGSPYWYCKLGLWDTYRTTGTKVKGKAMKIAMLAAEETNACSLNSRRYFLRVSAIPSSFPNVLHTA